MSGDNSAAQAARPLLEARGIRKHFGGEYALAGVDFDLRPGEIHGLLGENGAGKSTLIKILAGVQRADEGTISVDGRQLPHRFFPDDVTAAGLAFVHQDLGLAEHLSVAENVALTIGYEHRGPLVSIRATERRVAQILDEAGIEIPPGAPVAALTQDQKVMVAVARAFSLSAKAVILDEVSSSLPAPAVRQLAQSLRASSRTGVGYVYVTHRLEEVFHMCDRITVLRDGKHVATAAVKEIDHDQVVRWILDGAAKDAAPRQRSKAAPAKPAPSLSGHLSVRSLSGPGLATPVDLDVEAGEILGLCGLVGCGARELAALLGGGARPLGGEARLDGKPLPLGSPFRLRAAGCTYVPGDRQSEGAAIGLSVRENLFLARLRTAGRLDSLVRWPRREREETRRLAESLDVRPRDSGDRPLYSLSGGNQQKVVFGRALRARPRLLVVDDPTTGVDVGARAQLHQLLRSAAEEGAVVVMASTDFEEVAALADRALVLSGGQIHDVLAGVDLTPERLAESSYGGGTETRTREVPS